MKTVEFYGISILTVKLEDCHTNQFCGKQSVSQSKPAVKCTTKCTLSLVSFTKCTFGSYIFFLDLTVESTNSAKLNVRPNIDFVNLLKVALLKL